MAIWKAIRMGTLVACFGLLGGLCRADSNNSSTDWFRNARYGVFMHFLPGDARQLALTDQFDVDALARQLEDMGARYFVLTLQQNSGYCVSPNRAYSRITKYCPGERASQRDLPLDLYNALHPRGIRLMLYLPCQPPNRDTLAQRAFGLPEGPADQPLDEEVAQKWAEVIQEWSDRYGDKVAGWWFDGGYEHIQFNEAIAQIYAKAVKHGNPRAIVSFNPGVKVVRYTQAEDYTAGELNEPFGQIPASRWLDGSQWHALTFLGANWSDQGTRYPAEKWAEWVKAVTAHEGVVTLDMGPNWDPAKGPIGSLAPEQVAQVKAIWAALKSPTAATSTTRTESPEKNNRVSLVETPSFDFPLVDFHTHLKGGLTLEEVLKHTSQTHINHGIAVNGGIGFPITNDAGIEEFRKSMENSGCYIGLQAEGREWTTLFSPEAIAKFDYVFTDAMTIPDHRGKRTRLWIKEEVEIPEKQAFMDLLVKNIVSILDNEPIDIYVNPTFLPDVIAAEYDSLWTPERMQKVVDAAVRNGVAIEINSRLKIPSAAFIRLARQAGIKFTLGTNNTDKELGQLEYSLQMVKECGLTKKDMWMPKPDGQKPIQVKAKRNQTSATSVSKTVANPNPTPENPKRLKRADSFLGIHFDFHAGTDCTEIGKNTTREMIESVIDQVHPDYLQIDCKGHPGLSSYPTNAGNRAPGFVGDPLRLWRQVTAERGVSLYMHYSGVWDSEAIRQHPDWAAVNADGKPNGNATSFFGPYAEKLLIPQLRELSGEYQVDGAWVDGECWASVPDYGEAALQAFKKATGIQNVPRNPGDPNWYEFLQFNREAFRNYLRHYITEVKKTNPEMQLCSNWAFTDHMPEAVCAPVDFISGDYSPEDSVNSARFSARYMARQGKPWDLMAWSFAHSGGQKSTVQLQREAAVVLALGGGFQAYFTQRRDGSIKLDQIPVMAEVAKFCRARQAICHRALPVPQVAVLYSTAAHYREINGLFPRDLTHIRGTLQALLESQQSVEVLGEHQLKGHLSEYPLIVVPECSYLEPEFKQELLAYVQGGGHLLLVGPQSAALFQPELGIQLEGTPQAETRYLAWGDALTPTKGQTQSVKLESRAKAVGQIHAANDPQSPAQPAASVTALGQGQIAATYFAFSQGYIENRSDKSRGFLNELARQLFPKPLVEVKGSSDVDVSVNRIGGRLAVNLVNTAGPHAEKPLFDSIPPVGPLEITIRAEKKPEKVTLEPGSQPQPFEYRDGAVHLTLPKLEIHSVVVVD